MKSSWLGRQDPPQGAHYHEDGVLVPMVRSLKNSKATNGSTTEAYIDSVSDQHSICPSERNTLAFYTKFMMPEDNAVLVGQVA